MLNMHDLYLQQFLKYNIVTCVDKFEMNPININTKKHLFKTLIDSFKQM
jgi:hypothetical protein